jgi:Icc-related predicted phosphoesterase
MKFLAFVDLHEDKKALKKLLELSAKPEVDFIICAGDLTQFSRNIRFILRQFNELGKKIYLIPGNHESDTLFEEILPDYQNFVDINNKAIQIGDYVLLGYGGGGFSSQDADFRRIARDWYSKYKDKKIILVIHGPPYGTKTDFLEGHYVGNKDYRAFIERIKPKLVICGHIHETAGMIDKIEETQVINPGSEGMFIDLN